MSDENLSDVERNRKEFLNDFLKELQDVGLNIRKVLTALEADPSSASSAEDLFRSLHTVKGLSASFGFESLRELYKTMEDVAGLAYKKQVPVDEEMIAVIRRGLVAADFLREEIKAGRYPENASAEQKALIENMRTIIHKRSAVGEEVKYGSKEQIIRRYFYKDMDVTPQIAFFQRFFFNARNNTQPLSVNTEFLAMLDVMVKKLNDVYDYRSVEIFQKIKNDFLTLIGDDGTIGALLRDLVEQEFGKFLVDVTVVEDQTAGVVSKSGPISMEEAFRVEAKKLDEISSSVAKISVLSEEMLTAVQTVQDDAQSVKEFALHYRTVLMSLNNTARKTLDRLTTIKESSLSLVLNKAKQIALHLAGSEGKKLKVIICGDYVAVGKGLIDVVDLLLMDIVKQRVGCGLEIPGDRRGAGKPEEGRMIIEVRNAAERLEILISDDGLPDKLYMPSPEMKCALENTGGKIWNITEPGRGHSLRITWGGS